MQDAGQIAAAIEDARAFLKVLFKVFDTENASERRWSVANTAAYFDQASTGELREVVELASKGSEEALAALRMLGADHVKQSSMPEPMRTFIYLIVLGGDIPTGQAEQPLPKSRTVQTGELADVVARAFNGDAEAIVAVRKRGAGYLKNSDMTEPLRSFICAIVLGEDVQPKKGRGRPSKPSPVFDRNICIAWAVGRTMRLHSSLGYSRGNAMREREKKGEEAAQSAASIVHKALGGFRDVMIDETHVEKIWERQRGLGLYGT